MREITYAEAVREAMSQEMRKDPNVFLMGEDIGVYGGAFEDGRYAAAISQVAAYGFCRF